MPNMKTVKTVANVGEKAAKAAGKVLPGLSALGKALAVIYGTMTALTAVGWVITRARCLHRPVRPKMISPVNGGAMWASPPTKCHAVHRPHIPKGGAAAPSIPIERTKP